MNALASEPASQLAQEAAATPNVLTHTPVVHEAAPAPASDVETHFAPVPAPGFVPTGALVLAIATHYGIHYTGQPLGCGNGLYSWDDPSIVAVGYEYAAEWPCGTDLIICGNVGCIHGVRQDTCPGCIGAHVDLSEAGINTACGDQADVCHVAIQRLEWVEPESLPAPAPPPPSTHPVLLLN